MSNNELWFWFGIACIAGLTLTSIFKSIFYFKHEAKRQIELAKYKTAPNPTNQNNESKP